MKGGRSAMGWCQQWKRQCGRSRGLYALTAAFLASCVLPFILHPNSQQTAVNHHVIAYKDGVSVSGRADTLPNINPNSAVIDTSPEKEVVIPNVKVNRISCAALFNHDHSHLAQALAQDNATSDLVIEQHDRDFREPLRHNCSYFKRKRQYITSPVSKAEEDFPLAFSILTYDNPRQTERLLRAVYRPQNFYCIHVDKMASDEVWPSIRSIANCFSNVVLASEAVNVRWGTFSVLAADLICMETLLKISSKWKYFINLTGKEFPLRTNAELVSILKLYGGANEVNAKIKRQTRSDKARYMFRHDPHIGNRLNARKPPPPYNVTLVKGSVHVTLSRSFVNFTLRDPKAKAFLKWSRDVSIPDEIFFSTLNYNPAVFKAPGSYTGPEPDTDSITKPFLTRYKEWQEMGKPCSGQFVRQICIFGMGDLKRLKVQPHFFVNKLYDNYQPLAYDCLEEHYFNSTRRDYKGTKQFDLSFYEKQSLVKYHVL